MQLDIVIPTFNRAVLLRACLSSIVRAHRPEGVIVRVIVVDNNSTDETRQVVDHVAQSADIDIRYIFEPRPGKSRALNSGIGACSGTVVGMIDDDEQIDSNWITVVDRILSDPTVSFLGGPYHPHWIGDEPANIPKRFQGFLGLPNPGSELRQYSTEWWAIMPGGNAVVRRAVLNQVGPFDENLGPIGGRRVTQEDSEMHARLLKHGAKGLYVPDLVIFHALFPERFSKKNIRRWVWQNGLDLAELSRANPSTVKHFLGVPRFRYREILRDGARAITVQAHLRDGDRFESELVNLQNISYVLGCWFPSLCRVRRVQGRE